EPRRVVRPLRVQDLNAHALRAREPRKLFRVPRRDRPPAPRVRVRDKNRPSRFDLHQLNYWQTRCRHTRTALTAVSPTTRASETRGRADDCRAFVARGEYMTAACEKRCAVAES